MARLGNRNLLRWRRKLAVVAAGGMLCQAGSCIIPTNATELQNFLTQQLPSLVGQAADIVAQQTAAVISDTIFFLLNNALVRLTT